MKNLKNITLCVSILLYSFSSTAQTGDVVPVNEPNYNKTKIFQALPDNIPVNGEYIVGLFSSPVGRSISLNSSEAKAFQFDGEIVSSVTKYEGAIQSVIIRSTNYNGARLTVSKITDANGNISYTGRILSLQNGDLYELKNINNQFVLAKRNLHDLVNE